MSFQPFLKNSGIVKPYKNYSVFVYKVAFKSRTPIFLISSRTLENGAVHLTGLSSHIGGVLASFPGAPRIMANRNAPCFQNIPRGR